MDYNILWHYKPQLVLLGFGRFIAKKGHEAATLLIQFSYWQNFGKSGRELFYKHVCLSNLLVSKNYMLLILLA